jgi:hypothetical protein
MRHLSDKHCTLSDISATPLEGGADEWRREIVTLKNLNRGQKAQNSMSRNVAMR